MILQDAVDRLLGRAHLEIADGAVDCPLKSGRLDVEACASCPYWFRTDVDEHGHGVVVCRARTLCGSDATMAPPL